MRDLNENALKWLGKSRNHRRWSEVFKCHMSIGSQSRSRVNQPARESHFIARFFFFSAGALSLRFDFLSIKWKLEKKFHKWQKTLRFLFSGYSRMLEILRPLCFSLLQCAAENSGDTSPADLDCDEKECLNGRMMHGKRTKTRFLTAGNGNLSKWCVKASLLTIQLIDRANFINNHSDLQKLNILRWLRTWSFAIIGRFYCFGQGVRRGKLFFLGNH